MQFTSSQTVSLLDLLIKHFPESSKTTLRDWIKQGRISIDGHLIKNSSHIVKEGQKVLLSKRKTTIDGGIKILYEDTHIVVIEKPNGLLTVSTAFEKTETAHSLLKRVFFPQKIYVVHRLDQDTSGVLIFAKSEEAKENLKKDFEKHAIVRQYLAIVEGRLPHSEGTWSSYLFEDAQYYVKSTSDPSRGKLATTHYRVIHTSKHYSLIELTLETGRKNQIRVHCQEANHPVAGDKKYGATKDPLHRLCLHAKHLTFTHPISKKKMTFDTETPEEFSRLFKTIVPESSVT